MRGESSAAMRSRMCYQLGLGTSVTRRAIDEDGDAQRDLRMLMGRSIEELESSEGGGGPQDEWFDYMQYSTRSHVTTTDGPTDGFTTKCYGIRGSARKVQLAKDSSKDAPIGLSHRRTP
jgi:hypothetical protein